MNSLQGGLQELLDELISTDKERGLQVAAYHQGHLIADAWAGWTDKSMQVPIDGDTLFPVFSVSKGIASTIVHRLVGRGLLDYETPISHYWPEFGCHGKEHITLAQGLAHTAGIPQMPADLCCEDLGNWDHVCAEVAKLKPLWPPGSQAQYHAITFGWIVGEPACRVTGRDFSSLLEEEIKIPLRLRDIHIGSPQDLATPVAVLEELGPEQDFPPNNEPAAIPWWTQPLYRMMNRPDMQRACVPATSGLMSARAVARFYAAFAPNGIDGIQLLPPALLQSATKPRLLPDGSVAPFALGYILGGNKPALGNRDSVFGHGGHGGSLGFYDPDLDLAFAFTHNRMQDSSDPPTAQRLAELLRSQLPVVG